MTDRWIVSLSWEEGTADGRTVLHGAQHVHDDKWTADDDARNHRAHTGWLPRTGSNPIVEGPTLAGEPWHNPTRPAADEAFAQLVQLNRTLHDHRVVGEHWHGGPNPCPVCGGIRPYL